MRRVALIVVVAALAAYIAWDRLEVHWLAQDIAAIAARGEPIQLDAGLPEPQTAQQREAANLYAQASAAALEGDDNGRVGRIDVERPNAVELSLDDIRANYPDDAPALQLLDRATPLDFGGFTAEQRAGDEYQVSILERGLSSLASVACLRADLASLRGDGDAAVRALVGCIRVKRTVAVPQYRAGVADRILGSVRILFRHSAPSDGALVELQHALDSWQDVDRTASDVMRDRARFVEMSGTPVYPGIVFVVGHVVLHPFAVRSARRTLERFDPAIAIARAAWADRWAATAEIQRAAIQRFRQHPPTMLGKIAHPFEPITVSSQYVLTASAHELAARRLVVTTVAIERYRRAHAGVAPAALGLPEDPFSGKPLIYKNDAAGYVIYSVDVDRKDDGGILYGFGAAGLRNYGAQAPRDYGIRVPLKPQ